MYIHTNTVGDGQLLKNKFNATTFHGDEVDHNGKIRSLTFMSSGLEGERLYVRYPDGSTEEVENDYISLDKDTYSIEIVLDKKTNQETYVTVLSMNVNDADAPEIVSYSFTGTPPTSPGDLGNGTDPGDGGIEPGSPFDNYKHFYVDYRDYYRLDYWDAPSSATLVKLVFTSDSGAVYDREWPIGEVGGTLYLTCSGTYDMHFVDGSGNAVSSVSGLATSSIQNNVCSSYPEPVPKDDLNANVTMPACTEETSGSTPGLPKVSWDAVPGADRYDIYKDGELIGSTPETNYDLPGDGSYSIVGKDQGGNVVGESDVNTPYIGAEVNSDADAICQCIRDLEPILNEIRDNTQAIHQDLQETNKQLGEANENLKEIIKQLTPTKDYPLPTPIVEPDLYEPDEVMPESYENDQVYFTDPGAAETPDSMPAAPEPEAWEMDGVTMEPETELVPDEPLTADPVIQPDAPMTSEPELQADPEINPDQELILDPELEADPPMQVVEEEYELRWRSDQYP